MSATMWVLAASKEVIFDHGKGLESGTQACCPQALQNFERAALLQQRPLPKCALFICQRLNVVPPIAHIGPLSITKRKQLGRRHLLSSCGALAQLSWLSPCCSAEAAGRRRWGGGACWAKKCAASSLLLMVLVTMTHGWALEVVRCLLHHTVGDGA